MKRIVLTVAVFAVSIAANAMPLGLRTATWGIAGANTRSSVANLLPETCTAEQLRDVMDAFSDRQLVGHITNATEYAEFRKWAIGSRASADSLVSSSMTWKSFAMNLVKLTTEPKEGDLIIDNIQPGEGGNIEMVFSLEDASIGADALESRLKSVFGVEGAKVLSDEEFSDRNISIVLTPTGDGRVRAIITPPQEESNTFFIRVKIK